MSNLDMLTPQNHAFALIDYQPAMYQGVQLHDRLVTYNMRGVLRIASFLGCAGLALLAVVPLTAPVWTVIIAMILTGSGIGMCA